MIVSVGKMGDLYIFPDPGEKLPELSAFNIDPQDPWHYIPKIWNMPCIHQVYIQFAGKCKKRLTFMWWCCYYEDQTCISHCESCNERTTDQSRQGTTVSTIQLFLKTAS